MHQWQVDQGRQAAQARPARHRPRPGGAGRPARVLPGGAQGPRRARRARPRPARPVTSGSKGLHLYAALPRKLDSDGTTALAKEVAEDLQKAEPALITATMTKAKRPGKVFLDWSQNSGSKTTISPYSLRGRERPTVATPVTWDEVEARRGGPARGSNSSASRRSSSGCRSTATSSTPDRIPLRAGPDAAWAGTGIAFGLARAANAPYARPYGAGSGRRGRRRHRISAGPHARARGLRRHVDRDGAARHSHTCCSSRPTS